MAAESSAGNNGDNSPWGWLGLLKWSLAHSDGTSPSPAKPMSDEDKAFLEKVMKEGIIDEGERMKEILKHCTNQIEQWKERVENGEDKDVDKKAEETDEVLELLQELRDIVEQIDYARAFCNLKGLNFILGVVSSSILTVAEGGGGEDKGSKVEVIPQSVKSLCLGILSTLCQHNPPVQKELLELGSIKKLTDMFQQEIENVRNDNGKFCAKIMQAISANVRSYDVAEALFLNLNEQSKLLIETGLGMTESQSANEIASFPLIVRKRTLFFLSAIVSSEVCTTQCAQRLFSDSIQYAIENFVVVTAGNNSAVEIDDELRENTVLLIEKLLEQKKCLHLLLSSRQKTIIQDMANQRIGYIQSLPEGSDDREFASVEMQSWINIQSTMQQRLQEQQDDNNTNTTAAAPLLLGPSDTHMILPQ